MPYIFISYSHKDREYANRLANSLEARGLDVWIDERIDYGEAWLREIQENLDACSAFVVIMTRQADESRWVQNELTRALRLEKRIFPLLLEGAVWLALETHQYVDVRGAKLPPERFYNGLAGLLSTGQPPAAGTTNLRERLATELGELQRRYDNLTSRIAAVDTDLGRELDSERRLTLEDRRAELAGKRNEVSARMVEIEKELTEQPASERAAPALEQKSAALVADDAKTSPKPAAQVEPVLSKPARPVEPARPDLLILDKPLRLELVRVPAGEFLMGTRTEDISWFMKADGGDHKQDWYELETPQHRLSLPEFYIGKYSVTNEQYAVFVRQTKSEAPWHWNSNWDGKTRKIPSGKEKHPVVNVSWHKAREFCEWLSQATHEVFRLASEAEWEKAARGVDGRLYPWGNQTPTSELCNFVGGKINHTTPVDQYPKGASPYGALNMVGNVMEWTSSLWGTGVMSQFGYPYVFTDGRENLQTTDPGMQRVVRGFNFMDDVRPQRCACRGRLRPDLNLSVLGFRVVCVSAPS